MCRLAISSRPSNANLAAFLKLKEIAPSEHERWRQEYLEFWPFAPQLIQLLEDQILVATQAQDTRDLIRILAKPVQGARQDVARI